MNELERPEPTDEELRAIGERARDRRARELGASRPTPRVSPSTFEPVLSVVRRGERCPACRMIVDPAELHESDPIQCRGCRSAIERKATKAAVELQERIERIPPAYRGEPPWTRERPPPFLPDSAIRIGLEWLASKAPRLSIFGEQTGSGKSTLAGFLGLVDAHDGRGWEWVHARNLLPPQEHEHPESAKEAAKVVATAPRVIVDGLGKELRGHDPTSNWAPRKREVTHALIGAAHEATKQRFIFTFDMGIERVPTMYDRDASFLRRVAPDDGKTVIVLQRQGALRVAKGGR